MQKSATVVCVCNNKLLLLRRAPTAKWKAGMYCLPGGKLEKGETLKDGAIRELFEETGIVIYRDQLGSVKVNYPDAYTKVVFTAKLDNDSVVLNYEHDHYIWVPRQELILYPLVPGLPTTIKTLMDHGHLI